MQPTTGSLILDILDTAALLGFLLVFWWLYRAVDQIARDLRDIHGKLLPTMTAYLRHIGSNTDPNPGPARQNRPSTWKGHEYLDQNRD